MPSRGRAEAPAFAERLSIRPRWWALTAVLVGVAALEVSAGFAWQLGLGVFGVLLTLAVVLLTLVSRPTIRVDERGLHAGGQTMGWQEMDSVQVLDREQTRLRMGPQADPAAHTLYRGWIRESVLVTPLHENADAPYWLVSSRRPTELLQAIERTARQVFHA